ncbi:MAG: hypothetical protein JW876_09405 [Candidatus Krumholzibacteriota bacterium]|nr:hypothetical protein [Candidatus Krumholzibacteriota bacterium]
MFEINPDVIAVTIPIMFLIGAVAVVITAIVTRAGHKELLHKERLAAMEKGIPIPEEPARLRPPRYLAIRAWGLVFLFVGIAVMVGIIAEAGIRHGLWGLIPTAMGAALLLSAQLERSETGDR